MFDKEYVADVAELLFPYENTTSPTKTETSIRDIFSSIYFGQCSDKLSGNFRKLVEDALRILPNYCKNDLCFAYSFTQNLFSVTQNLLQEYNINMEDLNDVDSELAEEALKKSMNTFGLEEHPDGLKHQEPIAKEYGELISGGLWSSKDQTPAKAASREIKKVNASMKQIEDTLRNVSAVSDSLIRGIESTKSKWGDSGYAYGRDIKKMHKSEYPLLQSDATKTLWFLKYAKGELLQESSQEKKGLGDLVIAIDTSGSTDAKCHGGNRVIDLEMGIALAMARMAIKAKCKAKICFHTTKVWGASEFMRSNNELNKFFAQSFTYGRRLVTGENDFDIVLNELFTSNNFSSTTRKPGVVFITDGYDSLEPSVVETIEDKKKLYGVKLYSYFVSSRDPRVYARELVSCSNKNYWIDSEKDIGCQVDNFLELN